MSVGWTRTVRRLPSSVPFVGPEALERALRVDLTVRTGANESVYGPSPRAVEAMQRTATESWMYGDPENHDLKRALSGKLGVPVEAIVVGEGIDGLLGYLVRLLVEPGDAVVTSDGAYPTFNYHAAGHGGVLHKVPYAGDHEDPGALVEKARETGAKLVYLANPDNPMGTWHDADAIEAMMEALPEGTVLCLDEAYGEFAPDSAVPPLEPLRANVVRMRTFSKAHGLAGLRVGYAITHPDTAAAFDKVRNHFGVTRIGQAAALASLTDDEHLALVRTSVEAAKRRIGEIGGRNGFSAIPSATNFQTLDTGKDGDFARALVARLAELGVFIRMPFVAPQDRCIRISAGTVEDLDVLERVLPEAIRTVRERKAA